MPKTLLAGYSGILFIRSSAVGLMVLAVTLYHPNVGLAGLLSTTAAYLFSRLIGNGKNFSKYEANIFNPFLVGCAVGYMFKPGPAAILLTMVLGMLTYVVTTALANVLYTYFKLPCLSLPFVIVSSLFYLAAAQYTTLPTLPPSALPGDFANSLPLWLSGYFKSLGAIFFTPHVLPGIVLALCILVFSRILFVLTLLGYFTGTVFSAVLLGSFSAAFSDINHFNSILTAAAVGGIFLIPSLKSYLLAVTAAGASTVFLHALMSFWWITKIPGFPLAFNIVTLGFVYTLGIVGYPGLTRIARRTPEENLDFYLFNRDRPSILHRTLMLPFSGRWTVWQGFDGQWTHRGNWKYAYDFIITDDTGAGYRGTGERLEDYYAFGKPVLSPVSGLVTKVMDHLPDNPIDLPDTVNNWGNHVIVRDDRGFFVELSHFSRGSVQVKEGDRVERGGLLGLCGNSGYSRQPHIHLQVQLTDTVGAYTVPFCFSGYSNDNRYHAGELPPEGSVVEPLYWNRTLEQGMNPPLDDVLHYNVIEDGKSVDTLRLTVKMAMDGTRYFDSGRGKLYFGQQDGTFYFYGIEGDDPYLKTMLQALPSFPLACRRGLEWEVRVPPGMVYHGWRRVFYQLLASFSYGFARVRGTLLCPQPNTVSGTLRSSFPGLKREVGMEWDDRTGFSTFRVGSFQLRRMKERDACNASLIWNAQYD